MSYIRDVPEFVCFRCIRRRLRYLANHSCIVDPPGSSIYCDHRISYSMALGMGWCRFVHGPGDLVSDLDMGTNALECICGNFRSIIFVRCTFSFQLGIQTSVENMISFIKL